MTSEPKNSKPKRRWFRFSLRTFFVLLTVFCVWFGWQVHRAKEQREVVEWVRSMGGNTRYRDRWFVNRLTCWPWFGSELSDDFLAEAYQVDLHNSAEHLDLSSLKKMRALEWVNLEGASVDQEQVEALQQALPNCQITWSPPSDDDSP